MNQLQMILYSKFIIVLFLLGFCESVYTQSSKSIEPKTLYSDSSSSSMHYYDRELHLTSVSYSWFSSFIIKQRKTERFNFQLSGSQVLIDVEIYQRKGDSVFLYKSFNVKEDEVQFLNGNRLIYQTSTESRGGGSMVYRLVDLEDNEPFTVYNHTNNCKRVMSKNGDRWLSIYSNSYTGFSDWNLPAEDLIYLNGKEFHHIWSIVYSNEDEIFDIIDAYQPYFRTHKPHYDGFIIEQFSILGDSLQTSSRFPNNYFSFEEKGEFQNMIIDIELKDFKIQLPIIDLQIQYSDINVENLVLRRRSIGNIR